MPSSSLGGCLGLGSSSNDDSSVSSNCNSTVTASSAPVNASSTAATATVTTNISSGSSVTSSSNVTTTIANSAFTHAAYYFGNISRETAEQILYDLGAFDGLFLIRESTATDSVLSLCHHKSILHYRISRIPSTGQVILHGTPIQVFPDFDTLIIKVQGLPIKPSIPADRNSINSLYSLGHQSQSQSQSQQQQQSQQLTSKIKYNTISSHHLYHLRQQQQQQQSAVAAAAVQQQQQQQQSHHLYSGGASAGSFYGAHIHYHHGHPPSSNNRSINSTQTLGNTSQLIPHHHLHSHGQHQHQQQQQQQQQSSSSHSHSHHLHAQASLYTSNPVLNSSCNVHYSQSPVANNLNHLNNQLNSSRSSSMWRLPLPEIKEAIIKKTKELGDELVYDTTTASAVFRSTTTGTSNTVKLIPVHSMSNHNNQNYSSSTLDVLKDITLEPPPLPSNPPPATLSSQSSSNLATTGKSVLDMSPLGGHLKGTVATSTSATTGEVTATLTSTTMSTSSAVRSITTYATLGRSKLKANTASTCDNLPQLSSITSTVDTCTSSPSTVPLAPVKLTPVLPPSSLSTKETSSVQVTNETCSVCRKDVTVPIVIVDDAIKAPSMNSLRKTKGGKEEVSSEGVKKASSTSESTVDGLRCTFCGHCRHSKCDTLDCDQFTSLIALANRYICLTCYDLASKLLKSGSVSLTASCTLPRQQHQWSRVTRVSTKPPSPLKSTSSLEVTKTSGTTSESTESSVKSAAENEVPSSNLAPSDAPTVLIVDQNNSSSSVINSIPSKDEMKQMIKEVVDDVIRSTITQVINEKVAAAASGSSSGLITQGDTVITGQLGSNILPSCVTTDMMITSSSIVTSAVVATSLPSSESTTMNCPSSNDITVTDGKISHAPCDCGERFSLTLGASASGEISATCACTSESDSGGTSIQSSASSSSSSVTTVNSTSVTLPSVTILDKASEERTKSIEAAKAEQDLLSLLRSPEVEVKNFLLKPKRKQSDHHQHQHSQVIISDGEYHQSSIDEHLSSHGSVSTLTKQLSHQLTERKDESSVDQWTDDNSVSDTVRSHHEEMTPTLSEGDTSDHSTLAPVEVSVRVSCDDVIYENNCSQREQLSMSDRAIDGGGIKSNQSATCSVLPGEKEHHIISHVMDERTTVTDDDSHAGGGGGEEEEAATAAAADEDDDGQYESIRFDREDLEPKSCLGFAPFVSNDTNNDTPPPPAPASSDMTARNSNLKNASNNMKQGEEACWRKHPIKLNQLDLICLEEENQEKIQEMVRIYKKGPISLDPDFVTLRCKIGSGFFGDVYLATIPLRNSSATVNGTEHGSDTSSVSQANSTNSSSGSSSNNGISSTAGGAGGANSTCNYIQVAVKLLRDSSLFNSKAELMREASLMATLDHKHIIRLIGIACDESPLNNKSRFMMVLELAPLGPLSTFLSSPAGQASMCMKDILILMLQVSMGMQYLESKNFVHRDLAARNVLLVTETFAKISDFGMSRALGLGKDYYKAKTGSKWPLKWFAPECIYYFKFSTKSDVWAFGITLWEALNYGAKPYEGMDSIEIVRFLNSHDKNQRLQAPVNTPTVIKELLTKCWSYIPENRPTFAQITQTLIGHLFLASNSSTSASGALTFKVN